MRLSLQTAFFPCLFTAITAVIYCATYETDYLWNMFNATLRSPFSISVLKPTDKYSSLHPIPIRLFLYLPAQWSISAERRTS